MKSTWFVFTSLENPKEIKTASNYLDYRTWDGNLWTAEFKDGKFYHYPNGKKDKGHVDSFLDYIADAGEKWRLEFEGTNFVHSPEGDKSKSYTDDYISYIGWDKRKWKGELLKLINHLHDQIFELI